MINIKGDEELEEQCEIEIIDVYQQPIFARECKIVADKDNLLLGMDLRSAKK